MSGEEDSSWLSIVIDRVDKLALKIGGYEDEAPGKRVRQQLAKLVFCVQ